MGLVQGGIPIDPDLLQKESFERVNHFDKSRITLRQFEFVLK